MGPFRGIIEYIKYYTILVDHLGGSKYHLNDDETIKNILKFNSKKSEFTALQWFI